MPVPLTPQEQLARARAYGRMGAYVTNSRYSGQEVTAEARRVFRESFADRVREEHPELDEDEVQRRGAFARRAWYAALSMKANKAKRARRAQREAAAAKRNGLTPSDPEPPPEDAGLGSPVLLPVAPGSLPDPSPAVSGDGSDPEQPEPAEEAAGHGEL